MRCGCPPSTLTTYVSKDLNRNIRMLMENYRAMRKRSEIKVKKGIYSSRTEMASLQSWVSWSPILESVSFEESYGSKNVISKMPSPTRKW
jgi:hypothetical protein